MLIAGLGFYCSGSVMSEARVKKARLAGLKQNDFRGDDQEKSTAARPAAYASHPGKQSARCLVVRKLLDRAFPFLIGIVVIGSLSSPSIATDAPIALKIVWSASLPNIPRLCYDKMPAVIYMKYDLARKMTSVSKRELDGSERVIGEFPGSPDPRSLSCSQDGQTIAALDTERSILFLMRGTEKAVYRFSRHWSFSNVGYYSFLAPDGKSITLPETPALVSGADLLRDIKIFPNTPSDVFFMQGYMYLDGDKGIQKYLAADDGWREIGKPFKRPAGFDATEIVRCGDHDVASLVGTESSRYMVLDDAPRRQDWLEQVGVRKLFRKYNVPFLIGGGFGACGFPLLDHAQWHTTVGLARLDANGVQTFSLPYPRLGLGDYGVSFSKDGCYVLLDGTWSAHEAPGHTHLLTVQSQQCR
jgi:hypothetical protein